LRFPARIALKVCFGRTLQPAHAIIDCYPEPVDDIPTLLKLLKVGPATQKCSQDLIRAAFSRCSQIEIAK